MEHARFNATGSFGSSASVDAISVERNLQRASCRAKEGCALVEACLRHRGGRDHSKAFFERVFPALVGRIVGVQGEAWLNVASEADAEALLKLLRVDGALLQAIRESDVHEEVRFAFPTRWLPKRTQLLLRSEEGCRILGQMPHYACHLAPDGIGGARVQVSLFEYLGFWLAVYATKGSARPSRTGQVATTGIVQEFATAAHFVKDMVTHHQVAGGKPVYQRLLEQLFSDYLSTPTCLSINQAASQGFQGETGGAVFAEYLSASRGGSSSILALGNCLLNILLDFWLSDASDVIDLQLNKQHQGYGTPRQGTSPLQSPFTRHEAVSTIASPIRASQSMAAYAYQPPSKDLCNAIRLMVTHFLPQEPETTAEEKVVEASGFGRMDPFSPLRPQKLFGSPGRFGTSDPETSSSQGCQTFLPLQRPLYRFLRKAFILWPEETTSSMTPIADIWLTYVTPWRMVSGEWDARFKKRESPSRHQLTNVLKTKMSTSPGEKRDGGVRMDQADFSSYWKKYVSQNLPFYNLLLYYFIETTCKRAQYHAERAVRNLVIVLRTLDLTPGLIDLMKDAEEAYSMHLNESSTYGQPALPMAEFMPLLASQMESWEFRQDGKLPEFGLFSSLRVKKMLHALLIRVESDVQHKLPSAVSERYRTFLKDYVKRIFGYEVSELSLRSLEEQQTGAIQGMGNGKAWCLPKYSWTDVSYRGDPMERPICSNEVAFLVRILVHWSVWINRRLGLDGQNKTGDKGAELHWLLLVLQQWACRHQIRINLRPLAEVQMLAWFAGLMLLAWIFLL